MRFVHTADWQLGMTRYFLNGEAQPRYSAARRDAVAGLGPLAAETGRRVRRRGRRRVRAQPTCAARRQPVAGGHARHRRSGVPAAGQPRSAGCVVGVHQRTVHRRMPGQCHGSRPAPACTRCGRGLQIVAAPWRSKAPTTDLVAEVLDGPAGRRDHPHRRRPRRRRHLRSRQGQAVADPARRARGRDRPRRCALCGVGRQALSHAGRRDGPHLVLRLAGGHQLRRHRARSGPRAGRRHRRGRSAPAGAGRRATGRPLAVRHAAAAPWTAAATSPTSTSTST